MKLKKIGTIKEDNDGLYIQIDEPYKNALIGLEGFSHLHILWWADQLDQPDMRSITTVDKPYKPGPELLGIFATRSPLRPNPICTTIITVTDLSVSTGIIRTWYIDGEPETPVLDIKPYLPCSDYPTTTSSPEWSTMLPKSIEASAEFDWDNYFNF